MNRQETFDGREDEILTLYYYNDGLSESEREQVRERLAVDPGFRARYESLEQSLDAVGNLDAYTTSEDRKARFAARIDALADASARAPAKRGMGNWLIGMAVAASLVIGVAIGINMTGTPVPGAEPLAVVSTETVEERPLVRRITSHLRDSQQRLLSADKESDRERMLLIRDIVTRNRAYIRQAEDQDDEKLARVLRAMEPVLLELAAGGDGAGDEDALSSRLLFELNVVLTKYGQDASKEAGTI